MRKFGLHSKRVLIDGELIPATVIIEGDKIVDIFKGAINNSEYSTEDFGNCVLMPGLIDSHVHVNEPGRTNWEGFDTATKSAAAGGITTIIDMPLNSTPVTIDKNSFILKIEAAQKNCHVNCGFWGGLTPNSHEYLEELIESGVMGIKVFLIQSGIDDFPNVTMDDLHKAQEVLKKYDTTLLIHCEQNLGSPQPNALDANPTSYQVYLDSRPREWEDEAILAMSEFCAEYQIRTHIVHLSSSNSLLPLYKSIKAGHKLTVETCPHYLYFHSESISDGSTVHKCAPPIREKENNIKLWEALENDLIQFVVSDHSPAPLELKAIDSGSFKKAWGGISSLQLGLRIMWTLAERNKMSLPKVAQLMSENVARFLDLDNRKGKIKIGFDADLVVWDPETESVVESEKLFHKHRINPYEGHTLKGEIIATFVNGIKVYNKGEFDNLHSGNLILKE